MPELLNGPLFSVILVILAGIALRYALWYGGNVDDNKPSAAQPVQPTPVSQSTEAAAELRSQLSASQEANRELQKNYQHLADDYSAFKEAAERQQHQWRSEQRALHEQEHEMAELRSSQARALDELETERSRREDVERQLQALTGEMNHMRHDLNQLVDERSQHEEQLRQMQEAQDAAIMADQVARRIRGSVGGAARKNSGSGSGLFPIVFRT